MVQNLEKKHGKIAVIEDDFDIAAIIRLQLEKSGFEVRMAPDFESAVELLESEQFDLVLVDWMLPQQKSGLDLIKRIRKPTPTIVVTAKDEVEDELEAFRHGVVDFIPKPFDTAILLSRVQGVLKLVRELRSESKCTAEEFSSQLGLQIQFDSKTVSCHGRELDLTKAEFMILTTLVTNENTVVNRETLIAASFGLGVHVTSRTIDTHIYTLRKKLGVCNQIETVRGFGYRFKKAAKYVKN